MQVTWVSEITEALWWPLPASGIQSCVLAHACANVCACVYRCTCSYLCLAHVIKCKINMCICAHILLGFPNISAGKESTCNSGDLGLFTGLGRSPEERNSYPLHYSVLENSVDCLVGLKVWHDWMTFTHIYYYIQRT